MEILHHHTHVFNEGLGTLQGYEAQLYVDPQAKPRYCKAQHSIQAAVEQELDCLMSAGILEPVQFATYCSSIESRRLLH